MCVVIHVYQTSESLYTIIAFHYNIDILRHHSLCINVRFYHHP